MPLYLSKNRNSLNESTFVEVQKKNTREKQNKMSNYF